MIEMCDNMVNTSVLKTIYNKFIKFSYHAIWLIFALREIGIKINKFSVFLIYFKKFKFGKLAADYAKSITKS